MNGPDTRIKKTVASLRARLAPNTDPAISPRPWKMWGWELRAPKAGVDPSESDVDQSDLVATFQLQSSRHGGSHVANLYFVCELVEALPGLLDEIERLWAERSKEDVHA